MRRIGTPPRQVTEWLEVFAAENADAARHSLSPFGRVRYRARAAAFYEARDLVLKSVGPNPLDLPWEIGPREGSV